MPRKPRIECAGAVYHILNRGNYRQDLFTVSGSTEAFERVLFDTCSRFGWRLYAYVILSNHYLSTRKTPSSLFLQDLRQLACTRSPLDYQPLPVHPKNLVRLVIKALTQTRLTQPIALSWQHKHDKKPSDRPL